MPPFQSDRKVSPESANPKLIETCLRETLLAVFELFQELEISRHNHRLACCGVPRGHGGFLKLRKDCCSCGLRMESVCVCVVPVVMDSSPLSFR
mmetsp:Transcript_29423/g.39305  ORF Transcript_29423/g.39305 Transcript_29423/m.39305 type:complete len:94 (+) Transcript_29423:829-1110(+)